MWLKLQLSLAWVYPNVEGLHLKCLLSVVLYLIFGISSAIVFAADEMSVVPSLEQLLNTEVQMASKHGESCQKTEAAVFILNQDDIACSEARTIPECLRWVPRLNVAQINSSTWSVSARGSEDCFSNLPLVMGNGRIVYNYLFGGVYRDVQDLMLGDADERPQHIPLQAFGIGVALHQCGELHGGPFLSLQPQQGLMR